MAVNPSWNQYETALLIDAYIKYREGRWERKEAVANVSQRLRARMMALGMTISETYRNENGISMQMTSIGYCFNDNDSGISHPSTLFRTMVGLYRVNPETFKKILSTANLMYPEVQSSDASDASEIEKPASKESLVQETEEDVALMVRESELDTYIRSRIHDILSSQFPKGFRLNSFMEKKKLMARYETLYQKPIPVEIDDIDMYVKACGVDCGGRVYLLEKMVSSDLRELLIEFILSQFRQGRKCIYYSVVFNKFATEFQKEHLLSTSMLRQYLESTNDMNWKFWPEYLTEHKYEEVDIYAEVAKFVQEQGGVVTKEEAVAGLSHIPAIKVETAFDEQPTILVSCGRGKRFHSSNFIIDIDDVDAIISIIKKALSLHSFISFSELMGYLKTEMPVFVENNVPFGEIGMKNVLAYLLESKFEFVQNLISVH